MTKTLLENINAVPALPESIQEVERVYQNEDSTFRDMQKVIDKDPLLTADILRIVNSPMYGVKSTVTSIKQAISLLGKEAVRAFAISSATNSFTIDLSPYNMTAQEFKLACDKQLALMIHWMARYRSKHLIKVAPAAFLVDIGRVIISKTLIEDGKSGDIQSALSSGKNDIAKAEKAACGAQTTDVTATLFHNWKFDSDIIHIIRYSDDPDGTDGEYREMAAELKAVREAVMPNGEITDESIATAKDTIEEFRLNLESFENALKKVLNS
ncbi:MAG: HDOD domain-containing protein [Campylobacterota bacterium]